MNNFYTIADVPSIVPFFGAWHRFGSIPLILGLSGQPVPTTFSDTSQPHKALQNPASAGFCRWHPPEPCPFFPRTYRSSQGFSPLHPRATALPKGGSVSGIPTTSCPSKGKGRSTGVPTPESQLKVPQGANETLVPRGKINPGSSDNYRSPESITEVGRWNAESKEKSLNRT